MEQLILLFLIVNCGLSSSYLFKKSTHGVGEPFISHKLGVSSPPLPVDQYFPQKLDHFNPTDETVWLQRYWRTNTFYKSSGPAFLMINGEATASPKWNVVGQWISYAEDLGAICFSLEHRYYGESRPKNDTSSENLVHLSSEQALADVAYFIEGMNQMYALPDQTKWIVFGGSYAGSLAAWARLKYPYLIHGAVSSSGPLLAKVDFKEYFEVVRTALTSYDSKCPKLIELANKEINLYMKSDSGREKLTNMFQLCSKLENNTDDITNLFANLADNFAGVVQYNKDNRESPTKNITIDTICDILDKGKASAISLYAEVNKFMLKVYNLPCLNHRYQDYIDSLKKVDYKSAAETDRQWIYQTCTEFGFYQTSSQPSDLFGAHFPVEFFTKQCEEIFGKKFNRKLLDDAVIRTNVIYGDLKINVGNIVYVHGSVDPWHSLGLTHIQNGIPNEIIYINGTAHCADMYPSGESDSQELKNARIKIKNLLRSWTSTSLKYKIEKKYSVKIVHKYYPVHDGLNFKDLYEV